MTDLSLAPGSGLRRGLGHLASVWLLIALVPLGVALLDPDRTGPILGIAADALLSTLPYIVIAVGLIASLKATGAEALVARAFQGRLSRMIVLAALFGGLAPFCSCEVIPFIAGLLALGAPLPAVMAFWLASPLIDPPTLFITAAALGWEFALAKAVAAVAIGLMGGFALRAIMTQGAFAAPLRARGKGGCCGCGPSPFEGRPVWRFWREPARRATFAEEARVNGIFLLKWMALAYLLEALLITYVPADAIASVLGGQGIGGVAIAALVGMPAYLNSYVAPPLVAGLIEQGMSPGAGLAFMVAGAVSSIPAMAAVWSLVKPRVFAAYLGLSITGAILVGLVFGALVGG
ncbi:MAG: permease [Proteobacteria bacterium]|nr:permease [Pseudomonadota bacterium]